MFLYSLLGDIAKQALKRDGSRKPLTTQHTLHGKIMKLVLGTSRFGFPNSANDTPQLLDFFRVLKEEGFFCAEQPYVLSLEVKPWGDEDEDIILANTKRVIRRAWAML